jgi:hypothetical protein
MPNENKPDWTMEETLATFKGAKPAPEGPAKFSRDEGIDFGGVDNDRVLEMLNDEDTAAIAAAGKARLARGNASTKK